MPQVKINRQTVVPYSTYLHRLTALFCAWKSLLLAVALASPGPGYDTSTVIFFSSDVGSATLWERLAISLTRWDGIYFTAAAHHGKVFEQEYAFSPFWAKAVALTEQVITDILAFRKGAAPSRSILSSALVSIALAHITHLGAVIILFDITAKLLPVRQSTAHKVAFTTAVLHIVSPAGLFLSAAYGESPFALLSFAGIWLYSAAIRVPYRSSKDGAVKNHNLAIIPLLLSSVPFALSTLIRGNGLLSGAIYLTDLIFQLHRIPNILRGRDRLGLLTVAGLGIAGVFLGGVYAYGQVGPYLEYCTGDSPIRPWCTALPPSIYTFVQQHYWNNGFLRYWTLSNLPLFVLAMPMILFMVATGAVALTSSKALLALVHADSTSAHGQVGKEDDVQKANDALSVSSTPAKSDTGSSLTSRGTDAFDTQAARRFYHVVSRIAIPQMLLALLCFTSFHVQIINRLSSGYPLWYIALAIFLHADDRRQSGGPIALQSVNPLLASSLTSPASVTSQSTQGSQASGKVALARPNTSAPSPISRWAFTTSPRTARNIVRAMVIYALVQGALYASFLPPA